MNEKSHTMYVNKSIIDMVKNSKAGESYTSSVVILPAGYSKGCFAGYVVFYVLGRRGK